VNKNIIIIGRGAAGNRYKKIIEKNYPSFQVSFWDRVNKIPKCSRIIIASSTKNHFKDFLSSYKSCSRILIEKPITPKRNDLHKIIQIADANKLLIFTGDQFQFSDLIKDIKKKIKSVNSSKKVDISIAYKDSLQNVTKKNPNSYFFDCDSGGVLYTFSHAYFVLTKIFGESLTLSSVKIKRSQDHKYETFVSSSWIKKNLRLNVVTDCTHRELEFKLVIDKKYKYDFINGEMIFSDLEKKKFPKNDRDSLINKNLVHFINGKFVDQFEISKKALDYIWSVKEKF
tara:strand:- start:9768 stop:10622 length:855 start_codon:yes stop_codon:yes gene_type:complete